MQFIFITFVYKKVIKIFPFLNYKKIKSIMGRPGYKNYNDIIIRKNVYYDGPSTEATHHKNFFHRNLKAINDLANNLTC